MSEESEKSNDSYVIRYSSRGMWRLWGWLSLLLATGLGLIAVLALAMIWKMSRMYAMHHHSIPHSMATFLGGKIGGDFGFLLAEWAVLTGFIAYTVRRRERHSKPLVTLSRDGIEIHSRPVNLGLLRWDEIREVRAYSFAMNRMVGITPVDISAIAKRLKPVQAFALRLNSMTIFGTAPINIMQMELPMPADELAAHIHEYKTRYGPPPLSQPGAWPPPPAGRSPVNGDGKYGHG